jgi:hypothetical protein
MCFYNQYEWIAEIYSDTTLRLDTDAVCYECGAAIAAHERRRVIHMEESDGRCLACDGYEDCCCETPNAGESFDCQVCRSCCALLAVIRLVERRAGCPAYTQQPEFGYLSDAMLHHGDGDRYREQAGKLFPNLKHRFLNRAQ